MRWPGMSIVLAAAAVMLLAPTLARADAIDGNWCADDGRVMTIEGPRILTPGGHRISRRLLAPCLLLRGARR